MGDVLLTKRIEFAAAHRYHNDAWDSARNRAVFGVCHNDPGHGHNYMLEVTIRGQVDEHTGMVVNLYDLKSVLEQVLEEFDHKHLNLDTPYFQRLIPTTENIAAVLWRILATRPEIGRPEKVRLFEDEDLYAEVRADASEASLTRRYHFSAAHRLSPTPRSKVDNRRIAGSCKGAENHGHNYVLHVTVRGDIDPDSGMVTDIEALNRIVRELVIERFDHRDLNEDPQFSTQVPTGENLARFIWNLLVRSIPTGRLERVGLLETHDAFFEYPG